MAGIDWHPLAKDQRLACLELPQAGEPMTPAAAQELAALVALRGVGHVAPNPLVGAVLVDRDHTFVAAGAHERLGGRHAEIDAFDRAEALGLTGRIRGGTLYVTLEPCAHPGRTPACAPRVASSGVARVIYGVRDPNPLVNGKGAALLAAHGIACQPDPAWEPQCRELAEIFLWNFEQGLPFVALKAATSLDGVMARRGDRRVFLTGPRARSYGHFLRSYYDAIIPGRMPRRVVLDPSGAGLRECDPTRLSLLRAAPESVLWVVAPGVDAARVTRQGARSLVVAVGADGRFAPADLLAAFRAEGITSLLLEGGADLHASFLRAGAVQKLHHFQATVVLGSEGDPVRFATHGAPLIADGPLHVVPLGDDLLLETRLRKL